MTTHISRETVQRLISDIKTIKKNPLHNNGIYYEHDETDMLLGYALIIGPQDTPYAYGNFLFKFIFPNDYPHNPPQVIYCTNDGKMRFNPNLYTNGKVCVSVLNTWRGEQWTGCQTISSILLTLCSLLNENPLTNEPGISIKHSDNINYNKIVRYNTIMVSILKIISKEYLHPCFDVFNDVIIENYIKNYENIVNIIHNQKSELLQTTIYNLSYNCNYKILLELLEKHYISLKNNSTKN
jgi:ubiquitin-conjugating enzyme E2 Z